ncbi:tape measure protein [Lactococcus lactis]|uniref:tape measure protein n=1 Tax=Lactococcus lactis TaxID=1358 RepID=UPI0010BEAE89|nr:tape measure protein [Lactococcus lactis]MDS1012633.1 tape measure protein [Lactococcus lactis]TKD79353.1 tape measure protein [Lactococcus lactis]UXV69279.1 tape measure protein [Lactococcus lactis subsp. lactis]
MADGTITIDIIMDDGSVKKSLASINGLEGATNKAGTSIKSMVAAMGLVKIASAAFDALKSSVGDAVSRFDTMQKFPKVMQALGFSAGDSTKSIKKLSDGIEGLPTKLDDVVSQTQQLTSITGDLNKSTDTVLALNNAFLASGASTEDANRGMIQYNQMLAKGTVDLQSWRSLQETMPLGLQKTAEAMGFTGKTAQQDLYAALQDGKVTFDQFNDQLIKLGTGTGQLATLAKQNSSGIATSFGNLRNAISKGMANTLTAIDKVVQALTGKSIAQNIDSLKGIINSAFGSINKSIEGSVGFFNSLKTNVTKVFGDIQKAIAGSSIGEALNILKSDFSDFIKSFNFNGLSGAFNSIGTTISTLFKSIDFSGLAASFGAALIGLQQPLTQYGSTLANYWKTIFAKLGPIVSSTLGTVLTQIPALFQALVSAVAPILTQISSMISKLDFSGIQAVLQAIIPAVVSGFQTMMAIVGPSIQQVITSFGNLWNAIQPLLTVLAGALMPAFQVIGSFLGGVFSGILTGVSAAFDVIRVVIQVLTPVVSALVSAFQYIAPVLSTIAQWVGYVIGAFSGLGGAGSSLKTILTDAWSGIKNASSVAGNVIGAVVNGIKGFFSALSAAGGGLSGALQVVWNAIKAAISVAGSAIGGVISRISGLFSSLISAGNSLGGGMSAVWSAITGTISRAAGTISGIINNIKGFFTGLANIDLSGAGAAIMNGFLGGLKGAYENVKDFIGGIGNWIKEHKGPISYDRKLLIPAGNSIMDGLNEGLGDSFKNVQRNVSGMADKLASGFNLNLPKVTAEYAVSSAGLNAGEQLAVSQLNSIRSNIQRQLDNQPKSSETNSLLMQAMAAVEALGNQEAVFNINGSEFARVTAKDNQAAQNGLTTLQTILGGGTL